jgi:hypothetical protein
MSITVDVQFDGFMISGHAISVFTLGKCSIVYHPTNWYEPPLPPFWEFWYVPACNVINKIPLKKVVRNRSSSVTVNMVQAERPRLDSRKGLGLFSLAPPPDRFWCPPNWYRRSLQGEKRPVCEVDHSLPSSTEAMRGAIPPLAHTSSWGGKIYLCL